MVNILGHGCYTLSCWVFLYSETVRRQYRRRWGEGMCNPTVRGNDLASAVGTHLCMWGEELGTFGLLVMFYHYSVLLRGYTKLPSQKLSKGMTYLISGCLAAIGVITGLVLTSPSTSDTSTEDTYVDGWKWLHMLYCIAFIPCPRPTITNTSEYFTQDILHRIP